MTTQHSARETWSCHAGDLAFKLRAPQHWAADQRGYLAEYLPGKLGDADLGTFELTVYVGDEPDWPSQLTDAVVTRRIEYVPGAVVHESRDASGRRTYAVGADALEGQPGAFVARINGHTIELYVHQSASKPHAYPLRLMREAMLRTYENRGALIFHGAGVDLDGRGIMVCGPRAAGKTTTLAGLLRSTQAQMLSNDRLILDDRGRLIAVPLPVPVARATIGAVPELGRALQSATRPQQKLDQLPTTFAATFKAEFSAREYARAFDVGLSPGSWLHTLVVPRFSESAEPAAARRLASAEVVGVLTASCFTPNDEFWLKPWLVPRTKSDDALTRHARQTITRLAPRVDAFEVRFGVHNPFDELTDAVADVIRSSS